MRVRLAALLPIVLLLTLFVPMSATAQEAGGAETVVDELDELDELTGDTDTRAQSTGATTEVIETPIAFSMLAFTAPPGAQITYRTSVDGRTWRTWADAEPADGLGPDAGTAEALHAAADHRRSGEPTWVGEARWLQARVTGAALDDVQVDLIDSMGLSRSLFQRAGDALRAAWRGTATGQVAQAGSEPAVVNRAQWGADERLRTGAPSYAGEARYAVLHHTVNTNDYTREQAPGIVRGIYAYHTQSRGWSDIGYNVLVDRFGTIYEGRAGGLTKAVIGAHALGFNTGSIGVAMIGNHDSTKITAATWRSVTRLVAWKFAVHGIDPAGTVEITSACSGTCKHPRDSVITMPTVFGHRDVGYTSCPGAVAYAALPDLRTAISAEYIDTLSYDPPFSDDDASVHAGNIGVLFDRGITKGCTATTFCPGRTVQRAQMASFLSRTMDSLIVAKPTPTRDWFSDDDRSVHQDAINALTEAQITSGCGAGIFCPTRDATRGDVADWLARAFDLEAQGTDHFTDDDGATYEWAINALADAGLTQGCTATTYCPSQSTSRGQMASFLARAIDALESSGLAG